MTKHYKNCLYIHGLHSTINPLKKKLLEQYFDKVTALHIDYTNQPDSFQLLIDICKKEKVDFIVGSSFGGYLGFYLSRILQLPAIVFNPALFFGDQDKIFIPQKPMKPSPFLVIVLGEKDAIIPIEITKSFIIKNEIEDNIRVITCNWLPHEIDYNTFECMLKTSLHLKQ